jgi:alkylation response protein AidB-like acyl-CoA dehydrogenase
MDDHFAWACIPPDTAGIDVDDEKELMGLRLCPFHSVAFHDVSLRGENVLALGLSPRDILNDFIRFDACLGAIGVGMAQETYVKASHYAAERYQGGRMICDHDAVREMLSRMALNIEAGRSLVKEASMMADSEPVPPFHMWSSVASAETAVRAALDGIQILGGYGYMRDYGMERMLRDAKTFQNTVVLPHCRTQEFIKQEFHSLRQGK